MHLLTDMLAPDEPHHSLQLGYQDGSQRLVHWSAREVPYPDGRLIVSRTGLDGVITHANAAFVELSGYAREELIGAPHHILRHPDMPKVAFKGLWDTILSGQKWHGYVKNLRKDEVVGFTSVRRKPSRKRIEELIPVYRQWLEEERNAAGLATEQAP